MTLQERETLSDRVVVLLGSRFSPFVRKVRVVLAEKGIECEVRELEIASDQSPVFAYNPLGKIPCLIAENLGMPDPVYDSSVIVEFLDVVCANPQMYPTAPMERVRVRRIEALADGILDAGVLARTELVERAEGLRDPRWAGRQMKKMRSGVDALAEALGDNAYFCGEALTIADYSVCVALAWLHFRFPELAWSTYHANLQRLFAEVNSRP